MPAPLGPLLGFLIGVAFAWCQRGAPPRERETPGSELLVSALFSLLVFAPVCGYFLAFWPDWAWAYLVDSTRIPSAVPLALVLLDAASVPVGLAAARGAAGRGPSALLRVGAMPVMLVAIFVAVLSSRLSVQATHAQFHGDFGTRPVAGGALGLGLLWMWAVLLGASVWTGFGLRRMARRRR
jgi:hypothetical protein